MAVQLLPNVYWLEGRGSNFYLCLDEDGLTLIDSGMPKREEIVWQALGEIGRSRTDLKRILITHADIDHAGSAAVIQAKTGAKVYASAATIEFLRTGKSPKHMPWYAQFIVDYFVKYKPVAEKALQVVTEGDELPILGGLQVLATPGHTLEHHAFFAPLAGILFAGDALNTRQDNLQRTPSRITADPHAANQSAIRLIQLTPAIIACGHGTPLQQHSSDDLMALLNQLRTEPM
jgi:glyoxylase-like metal-dependent hydrolase (beta-lactamase superfamily II)